MACALEVTTGVVLSAATWRRSPGAAAIAADDQDAFSARVPRPDEAFLETSPNLLGTV